MMPGQVRVPHPPKGLRAPVSAALETLWGAGLSVGGCSPDISREPPTAEPRHCGQGSRDRAHAAQQPRGHSREGRPALLPGSLGLALPPDGVIWTTEVTPAQAGDSRARWMLTLQRDGLCMPGHVDSVAGLVTVVASSPGLGTL